MHVCRLHAVVHPIVIFISKSHINCIYFIFCSKCLDCFITNKCRIIDEINCPCKLKGKKKSDHNEIESSTKFSISVYTYPDKLKFSHSDKKFLHNIDIPLKTFNKIKKWPFPIFCAPYLCASANIAHDFQLLLSWFRILFPILITNPFEIANFGGLFWLIFPQSRRWAWPVLQLCTSATMSQSKK